MRYLRAMALVSVCAMFVITRPAAQSGSPAQAWKFAVISDTQGIGADDDYTPNTVAVAIVKALNQRFIAHGVKFVVQVGDLVDQTGSTASSVATTEDTRAALAQELYNAGIGFFPLRGNHDSATTSSPSMVRGSRSIGVDPATHTAWAVIDYTGDFAVVRDIEAVPGLRR